MPDAAVVGILEKYGPLWAIFSVIALMAAQAFFGARGKNSAYPERDDKHDANQGMIRETQQIAASGFNSVSRKLDEHGEMLEDMTKWRDEVTKRFDRIDDTQAKLVTIGEVLKDRAPRV